MRIKTAMVYQPATPLRAVLLQIHPDGTTNRIDVPVIGVQMVLIDWEDGESRDECRHEILLLDDARGAVLTASELEEGSGDCELIILDASCPPDAWDRVISDATDRRGKARAAREAKKPSP